MWQGIAEHLAKATPEVLVLVHPIHLIKDSAKRAVSRQLHRSKSSPQDIMTGVTARQTSRWGSWLSCCGSPSMVPCVCVLALTCVMCPPTCRSSCSPCCQALRQLRGLHQCSLVWCVWRLPEWWPIMLASCRHVRG